MPNEDIIKIPCNIKLTDKEGNPIEVKTPKPSGMNEIFSLHITSTEKEKHSE